MHKHGRFTFELISFSVIRAVIDTSHRMIFSFLPIFARGLQVNLEGMALIISSRYALGIFAPYIGQYAEARGTKKAMLLGLLLFIIGFTLVSIKPIIIMFCIALLFAILGRMLFIPAMQGYISANADHSQRGFAMSIPEIGWSGASIIGIPITGLIITRYGWVSPFPWLAALGLLAMLGLFWWLPSAQRSPSIVPSMFNKIRHLLTKTSTILILISCLLMAISSANINIIYSTHIENVYNLHITALGITAFFLGLAELGGESLAAILIDRFKPGVAVCIGIGVNMMVAVLMPKIGGTLPGAVIGLSLIFLSSEFFMVGILPLLVNITPKAEITALSLRITINQGGVAIGTAIGPWLFRQGWNINFYATAILDFVALLLMFLFTQRFIWSKVKNLIIDKKKRFDNI